MIEKVALAVLKDKKVLMVRSSHNAEVFYTLGGKVEGDETDIQTLVREVKEELDTEIYLNDLQFLKSFEGVAHGTKNTKFVLRLYLGKLIGEAKPTSEIVEIQYFNFFVDERHLTSTGKQIFNYLKEKDYIN